MKTLTVPDINDTIKKIQNGLDRDQYIKTLFDPVQSHAVYNVPVTDINEIKDILKAHNASRFRVVKLKSRDVCIICFKLK